MGDPRSGINRTGFDRSDDLTELGRGRVAARHQRQFPAVKIRIGKGDVTLKEPHEENTCPVRREIEGRLHRAFVPRCVDDEIGELPAEGVSECLLQIYVSADFDRVIHSKGLATELEPAGADVGNGDVLGSIAKKREDAEPDRTGSENERAVACRGEAAIHGVLSDAEHLDERELIHRCARSTVEFVRRNGDERAHPAIGVDAEDSERLAAVRFSFLRGGGGGVVQIRLDRDGVARRKGAVAVGCNDFGSELMTEDTRILEEWLPSVECVDVCAANPDSPDAEEGFARSGFRNAALNRGKATRFFEADFGLHVRGDGTRKIQHLPLPVASVADLTKNSKGLGNRTRIEIAEEIVAFVVDENEGGEFLHLNFPDRFHSEFGKV